MEIEHNANWTMDISENAVLPIISQVSMEEITLSPLELQMDVVDTNKNLLHLLLFQVCWYRTISTMQKIENNFMKFNYKYFD